MKKALLIVPPRTVNKQFLKFSRIGNILPLGLMYIAAVLEDNGVKAEILDCLTEDFNAHEVSDDLFRYGLPDEEILNRIRESSPDYIGISCMFTTNYGDFIDLAKLIKKNFDIPVIGGGQHVTAEYETVLNTAAVDYCILGEGEFPLLNLIKSIENNGDLGKIKGLAYKINDEIKANTDFEFIQDLDALPFPAYHLIDYELYMRSGHSHGDTSGNVNWAPIVTSRGCPFRCTFCFGSIMSGRKMRFRSPENVIEEIRWLKEKFNIEELSVEDDNFAHDPRRAEKILTAVADLNLRLVFPDGLSLYSLDNDAVIGLMKKNKILSLTVAIESGDEHILKKVMHKPVSITLVKRVVPKLKKNGINVKAFFIIGMPGETVESLKNTYDLIKEINLDWAGFSIATPLPGTEMTRICKENGYINENLYHHIEKVNFSESVIDTPYMTHEQVTKYAYYFNVIANFIMPIGRLKSKRELKYKLFMYERVKKLAPDHKYAKISFDRAKIREKIISLKSGSLSIKEKAELEASEQALKAKQLGILEQDLASMPGNIVFFHQN